MSKPLSPLEEMRFTPKLWITLWEKNRCCSLERHQPGRKETEANLGVKFFYFINHIVINHRRVSEPFV